MVSTISVSHCTLIFVNPARLFHDFENVEWFVQRCMIWNDDVEDILTTLNDLYYVEWFLLTWIFCTCIVECVLTLLKDLHSCWMIWRVQWSFLLEKYPLENCLGIFSPMKMSLMNIAPWETPFVETPYVIIAL